MSPGASAKRIRARLRGLAGSRHPAAIEAGFLVLVYCLYDSSRGILGGGRRAAVENARHVFQIERWAHINVEMRLQAASTGIPGLNTAFDVGYVTMHLGVTVAALIWLYRRQTHRGYVRLRTALVAASSVALTGFTLFPTTPPRLTGIGVTDTVSRGAVNLNSSSLHWFYNPYAALPSVHIAYATLVGLALFTHGRRRMTRYLGLVYPLWVAVEVMVTGNHFLVDVVTGTLVALVAWWGARCMAAGRSTTLRRFERDGTSHPLTAADGTPAAA